MKSLLTQAFSSGFATSNVLFIIAVAVLTGYTTDFICTVMICRISPVVDEAVKLTVWYNMHRDK